MATKRLLLNFPKDAVSTPMVYHLVKDYDLNINIYRAKITEEKGYLVLEVGGLDEKIQQAIKFIRDSNIEVNEKDNGIHWDEDKCVHCGNCIPHCPTKSLYLDRQTMKTCFDESICIECSSCLSNCPYKACTSVF
ncbi:MAG: 4Fe-4S binding protein [Bacteriovoracaceae bacterium]|nr:4Fe-4S binding protein [Bacteriovoracaceae bacterium]